MAAMGFLCMLTTQFLSAAPQVAPCDTCGHHGKLRQSLPMQGEVKHFCFLRCLLHFCNQKVQTVHTGMLVLFPSTLLTSDVVLHVENIRSLVVLFTHRLHFVTVT